MKDITVIERYDEMAEVFDTNESIKRPEDIVPCGSERFYIRSSSNDWFLFEYGNIFYNGIKQKNEDGTFRKIWRHSDPIDHIPFCDTKYECKRRVDKNPTAQKIVDRYISFDKLVQKQHDDLMKNWEQYCETSKLNNKL